MNDGRRKMKRRKSFKRRTMGVVLALALVAMTVLGVFPMPAGIAEGLDYAPVAECA